MKDVYDYEFPTLAHPTSFPDNDCDSDSYFDDGEETFDDGVPRQTEEVEKPKPDVNELLDIIESQIPDEVYELFNGHPKREREKVA